MRRILFGILGWLALAVTGPESASAAAPVTTRFRLENGLDVVLHEDHKTPIVAVNIWYHVGSKDEAPGRNGFAHLFEHVMFQGSKHVAEDAYFRHLEEAGASGVNGTTNTDRTNYFETVPSNRLELALWLESDRMGFLLDHASDETFKSQREVVKNERRQNYENAPYGLVSALEFGRIFPKDHPYHLLTIGTPEDLDRATFEDVKNFFRTYYVPNNATLVIAGDIQPQKAKAMIEKYFAPIPRGKDVTVRLAPDLAPLGKVRLDVAAGVELPRVYVDYRTPAFFKDGDADLDVAGQVLCGGKSSRLYKRLVYDLQIAQDVSCGQGSMQLASVFRIVVTAKANKTNAQTAPLIDEEIAKLAAVAPSVAEIARAKAQIRASHLFELERIANKANQINQYVHYTNTPDYFDKDVGRYDAVDAASVKAVAATYLAGKDRVRVFVKPDPTAPLAGKLVAETTEAN